jgi:hypothetical protein
MTKAIYSEEVVIGVARVTLNNAHLQVDALSKFGFTNESLQLFDQKITECEALPREVEQKEIVKESTRNKNHILETAVAWCRDFLSRLEIVFGKKSPEYNTFPAKEFRKAESREIVLLGIFEMIIGLSEKYQPELAKAGQTLEIIQSGKDLYQQLREANVAQEIKKSEKHTATLDRQQKFADIYDMTNKINKIGRQIFRNDFKIRDLFESKWPKKQKGGEGETEKPAG